MTARKIYKYKIECLVLKLVKYLSCRGGTEFVGNGEFFPCFEIYKFIVYSFRFFENTQPVSDFFRNGRRAVNFGEF